MQKRICLWLAVFALSAALAGAAEDDPALAAKCEAAATRFLGLYANLQRHGGWAKVYHYPSLRRYGSGERHTLLAENDLDFGKGWGSAWKAMVLFLPAHEATGNPRWLDAAKKTADLLVRAQSPLGTWSSNYLVVEGERAVPHGRADVMGLEDSIQTHPIMFLVWMWRLTKDTRYRDAAVKGAELLVRAQNANGSWPQYWSLADGKPRGHGHGVLNDGATTEPMVVLLMMYHVTADERWLAPIPRAADWLIAAQNRQGGIPGWAEQYDADNNPCWARNFEPPAICPTPTLMARTGLGLAYRLTGNPKYLEPLRILARWLRENPRDEWGFYTDPKTAEPVYGLDGKLHKGGQSPDIRVGEWVKMGKHYNGEKFEAIAAELEKTGLNPPLTDEATARAARLARFLALRDDPEKLLTSQQPDGSWVGTSARTRAEQAVRFLNTTPGIKLVDALYARAVGIGKLPAAAGVSSELWFRAWPVADPYNTPLRRGAVRSFDLALFPRQKPVFFEKTGFSAATVHAPPEVLRLEAEAMALKGPFQVVSAEGTSGGKAIWGPAGLVGLNPAGSEAAGLATLPFRVERAGPYALWLRVYWHSGTEDSFWLRLDDGDWRTLEGGVRGEWQWLKMPVAALTPGEHRLSLGVREDGAVLDAIAISANPDYVPEEQAAKVLGQPVEFQETVPSAPSRADEHTTLLCAFDSETCDADLAKGDRRAGGVQWRPSQPGRFGSAVALTAKEAYLLYDGGANIPGERGKLSLWFRAASNTNPFTDGQDHYFGVIKYAPQVVRHVAEDRCQIFENSVAVLLDGKSKSLLVRLNDARRGFVPLDVCSLSAAGLLPDQWHYVSFSWDYPARRVRLALDGRGVSQMLPHRFDTRETLGLFLGNALYYNVLQPLGGFVDGLYISSRPD